MSFRVLIIPEDPINNGYILQPLVSAMLDACGKPHARVTVLTNPRARGYAHSKQVLVEQAFDRYAHYDLLLFLPDAEGKDRSAEFDELERKAGEKGVRLLCCAARQEVEVWLLAGHVEKLGCRWQDVVGDNSVKENVFEPFLARHGDPRQAGGGRDILMKETLRNFDGLLQRCPELGQLRERIRIMLRQFQLPDQP